MDQYEKNEKKHGAPAMVLNPLQLFLDGLVTPCHSLFTPKAFTHGQRILLDTSLLPTCKTPSSETAQRSNAKHFLIFSCQHVSSVFTS